MEYKTKMGLDRRKTADAVSAERAVPARYRGPLDGEYDERDQPDDQRFRQSAVHPAKSARRTKPDYHLYPASFAAPSRALFAFTEASLLLVNKYYKSATLPLDRERLRRSRRTG